MHWESVFVHLRSVECLVLDYFGVDSCSRIVQGCYNFLSNQNNAISIDL
uniref:Uncharacterized protein n=1 Tax=Arundo donax TaxID=35708 RepID=A0A0A9CBC9_ARUDO